MNLRYEPEIRIRSRPGRCSPRDRTIYLRKNPTITLSDVAITNRAAELLNPSAGSWGAADSNGSTMLFTADNEALNGSPVAAEISSIMAVLRNGTTLSGAIDSPALSLDASSTWTVTGDSTLTPLSDTAGISGSAITNIVGNGHTVRYDTGSNRNAAPRSDGRDNHPGYNRDRNRS